MASTTANGITIEYETAGDAGAEPLLLIMGLGVQLTAWDDEFIDLLVGYGFYVAYFDNRDAGLSTWFDEAGIPDLPGILLGVMPTPAYLLADMADDAAGLLDALGLESAHVLGASMGGMIAQSLAIGHPQRVRTLTSIMSTTGDPGVGQPSAEVIESMLADAPTTRDEYIEDAVKTWRLIGSPGFPFLEDQLRVKAGTTYDRSFHPAGTARQLVAIVSSPDRTPALRNLDLPTLVIHGESDVLVDPSGGSATAAAIPGAELWTIPGMGHDFPPSLFEAIAARVARLSGR